MSNIKVLKKITDDELKDLRSSWGEELDISVEDLGFCRKNELSEDEEKELADINKKIDDLCGPMHSMSVSVEGIETINGIDVPQEWSKRKDELENKIYSDFAYAAPGYVDETMETARENDSALHIPKGTKMYYDYPLSCVVVVEIQKDLEASSEFIQAFCDGYQEIYALERDSTKIKEGKIKGMMNRNRTDGCFGIWGHDIGDLVLEGIYFYKDGDIYQVEFSIGS